MTAVNIILWVFIAAQVVALIAILTMAIRGAMMIRRQRKERLKRWTVEDANDGSVYGWNKELENKVAEAIKPVLYGPKPPSFATNYLLNEGFLLLVRKPDQSIKLITPTGGESLLACFAVDHHSDTPVLINGVTGERATVDDAFINRWLTSNYTER